MEDDAPSTPSDDDDVASARRSRRTKKAGGARKSPRKKQSDSSHSTSPSSASRRKPKSIATARGSRLRSRTSALHSPSSVQDIGPMSRGKRLGTLLDAVLRKPHCPLPRAQTRCACVMNAVAVFNLLLFCVLLMLAVQTNSPFHSYDLLPTANARKFLQKADRPIKALSHENVLNTAIVELSKVYNREVSHFQDLPKLNIDRLCDLIVHNGARLFLIREGIIGADATAQYTPDNIHNMAIIEMEKVSGLHVSKIQAMNFAELDAFALQQMHVNFAYTTNGNPTTFQASISKLITKYKDGKPNATAAELAEDTEFDAQVGETGANFDYDGKVEMRQLATNLHWYTKEQFTAMFPGSVDEWDAAAEIGRWIPAVDLGNKMVSVD